MIKSKIDCLCKYISIPVLLPRDLRALSVILLKNLDVAIYKSEKIKSKNFQSLIALGALRVKIPLHLEHRK